MNTVTYLEQQFINLHALFRDTVADLSDAEWLARAAPGQNRIGFIVWHIPRTQDNIVQTWIRGQAEVLHQPAWQHWHALRPSGIGTGITFAEAEVVAERVTLAETLAYAEAVQTEIVTWLRSCTAADLDPIPDATAHLAPYPEYQLPEFRHQFRVLFNQPVWSLLMRPCIGHIHRHLGELQLAKALLRQ